MLFVFNYNMNEKNGIHTPFCNIEITQKMLTHTLSGWSVTAESEFCQFKPHWSLGQSQELMLMQSFWWPQELFFKCYSHLGANTHCFWLLIIHSYINKNLIKIFYYTDYTFLYVEKVRRVIFLHIWVNLWAF